MPSDDALPPDFTRLLGETAQHNPNTAQRALASAYEMLKQMARRQMAAERADHSLGATDLVHEMYLALRPSARQWVDRGHFFNTAAGVMRKILIDHARHRGRQKRGGGRKRVDLEIVSLPDVVSRKDPDQIIALDSAVERLTHKNPSAGQVVHLHAYAGLTLQETADVMEVSLATVKRKLSLAMDELQRALSEASAGSR